MNMPSPADSVFRLPVGAHRWTWGSNACSAPRPGSTRRSVPGISASASPSGRDRGMTPDQPALVLIADDVPANVELLHDQLRTLGFRTVAAHDGDTALEACFDSAPDL